MISRLNTVKRVPQIAIQIEHNPNKNPAGLFIEINQFILNFCMERIPKTILKMNNKLTKARKGGSFTNHVETIGYPHAKK